MKEAETAAISEFKSPRTVWWRIGLPLVLALVYFLFARLGLRLATLNESVSPVWPATGFAFASLLLFGPRVWWAITLGAFAANLMTGGTWMTAGAISVGNTLEALVGTLLILRMRKSRELLGHQTETVGLVLGATIGSAVSATIGVATLYAGGLVQASLISAVWMTWWVGDALGGLVVAPLLVQIREGIFSIRRLPWVVGVLLLAVAVFHFVFVQPAGSSFVFLLFPILLLALEAEGKGFVLFLSFAICAASVAATVSGIGPFSIGSLNERLVHLQLFLAAIAATSLVLAGFEKKDLTRTPLIVLIVCWILSGSLFYSFDQSERQQTTTHFANLVEDAQEKILFTMDAYEDELREGAALYSASKSVELSEWRAYNQTLLVAEHHPGMNGLGVIWPVAAEKVASFEREVRAEGVRQFKVKPVPGFESVKPMGQRYVIKFIDPIETNREAVGLDVSVEPARREAAELSRDSGEPMATSGIVLVQDQEKTPGCLIFFPVYRPGMPTNSLEARRRAHLAWIYSPVIYYKFFAEVFRQTSPEIELEAFEVQAGGTPSRIFGNFSTDGAHKLHAENAVNMAGRNFSLHWRESPRFVSSHNTIVAWVGLVGALAGLLLTNLTISLQSIGRRSRELADELTKELKQSREKFKEGERRLLYALDGSNDGIWDWNIVKSEMYVSGRIAATHGWPQIFHAATEQDLAGYAHPDDLAAIAKSISRVLRGTSSRHEVETRYRTVTGAWRWVLTRGKVSERDADGKPIRMTGVHIDIHALKQTQALLESTQDRLRNIANSVPSLISLWNSEMKCEFANEAFANWFGKSSEEMTGLSMRALHSDAFFEERRDVFERALRGEKIHYEREVTRELDGARRFIMATYIPKSHEEAHQGFYLFIQDITELKRAELEAVAERKVAIEATKIKSQFLANMSHEIRTPMNGIIGMTNLLLGSVRDPANVEKLQVIRNCGNSLLDLINDLLDFSKLEADKVELEVEPFGLDATVRDIVELLSTRASEKGLRLSYRQGESVPSWVRGDVNRFRQVLINLVANAIKFTEAGRVEVFSKAVGLGQNKFRIEFSVRDTGIGIPDEVKNRLFLSFSQADVSTTRRFGGTGLGLAISKGLCERMGGSIRVESRVGEGSTFFFDFVAEKCDPLAASASSDPFAELDSEMGKKHPLRILIAEDNRTNQLVTNGLLERLGYRADLAVDGREVLERLKERSYDLILMDCHMPEMDGFEATKAILESEISPRPRIVALSAGTMKADIDRCFAAGMDSFLAKPVIISALQKTLAETATKQANDFDHRQAEASSFEQGARFDQDRFVQNFRGMEDLARNAIGDFLRLLPSMMAEIEKSVADGDFAKLELSAHSLKGAVSNFFAEPARRLAFELEMLGKNAKSTGAEGLIRRLKEELRHLEVELTSLANRGNG